jgi:hypothetical protein
MAGNESALTNGSALLGIGRGAFDADALMQSVLRRARRSTFSDTSFVEPLKLLLRSYDEEADLSPFGRYAARFDMMRGLNNLLLLDAAEEADPSILARPIAKPVFITGLPRSSTTFLQMLLSQDPANAVPRCWQLIYPYVSRSRFFRADLRRETVAFQLALFGLFSPGIGDLHPLSADAPQECTDITAQIFQSLRFDSTHRIPTYQAWLDQSGHRGAFHFHRRFLQHLDAQQPGRRWMLKSPDHVFALDAIRAVYPDAVIVFSHRDPLDVIASCAKLTETLRRPFTRHIDRHEIGRQVAGRLIESANRMVAAASGPGAERILNLHYRCIVTEPMETVEALYRHCGLTLSAEAERRMKTWLENPPQNGTNRYSLADYGLEPGQLRENFVRYMETFAVSAARSGRLVPA